MGNKAVYEDIVSRNIAGWTFETKVNENDYASLHFNNFISMNWESVSLPYNQRAHNDANNIDVYCYELPEPEPLYLRQFSFYDAAFDYLHNSSSQHVGNENNLINNIAYIGFNINS